jgi:hypothetical protein
LGRYRWQRRELFPKLRISPINAVEKADGGFRVIHDLSWPRFSDDERESVNSGTREVPTSYQSIDEAAAAIRRVGRGAWLVKLDLAAAYRHMRVRQSDWPLLGFKFKGNIYVDAFLPFGSKASPGRFNQVADALAWIVSRALPAGCEVIHYLDDFLLVAHSREAALSCKSTFMDCCTDLGFTVKSSKTVGPAQRLVFLGLLLDTVSMTVEVDSVRLSALSDELRRWRSRQWSRRTQLVSLLGKLNFVARGVRLARSFLRRMIACCNSARGTRRVRLSAGFHADVDWWLAFSSVWNGVSFLSLPQPCASAQLQLFTDASGTMVGAYFAPEWLQLEIPQRWQQSHISVKELLAIVVAAYSWGDRLKGRVVTFRVDNEAAYHAVQNRVSKHAEMMELVRALLFAAARYGFDFGAVWIPGAMNVLADALSRNQLTRFRALAPQAAAEPTIPQLPPTHTW